jgi:hypothetical protein
VWLPPRRNGRAERATSRRLRLAPALRCPSQSSHSAAGTRRRRSKRKEGTTVRRARGRTGSPAHLRHHEGEHDALLSTKGPRRSPLQPSSWTVASESGGQQRAQAGSLFFLRLAWSTRMLACAHCLRVVSYVHCLALRIADRCAVRFMAFSAPEGSRRPSLSWRWRSEAVAVHNQGARAAARRCRVRTGQRGRTQALEQCLPPPAAAAARPCGCQLGEKATSF